jgi:hypothetical protein
MQARRELVAQTAAQRPPRHVEPEAALLRPQVRPQLAEQANAIHAHLLHLQRTAGNEAVGLLIGRRLADTTVVQRQADGTQAPANPLTTPVSPDEMFRQVVEYQRAIKATPKGAPPATSKIDPKNVGTPSGHGTWTGAAIQVLDASGKRVDIGYGMYAGGDHGEVRAIKALEHLRSRKDLAGGTIVVVVEKKPCKTCAPALETFAKDLGLREVKVYGPTRFSARSPKKRVTHKTAAQTSLQGKRPKTTVELIYSKTVGPSTPSPGPGPSGSKPPATPTTTPKSALSKKPPPSSTPGPSPGPPSPKVDVKQKPATKPKPPVSPAPSPSPGKGKWVSVDVDQKTNRTRLKVNWDTLGKIGTGLSGALEIWNALSTLDDAMKKLERIQSGGVDPEITKVLQAIDNAFPSPDKLAKDVSNDQFSQGVQSMRWLETTGRNWIDDQGRIALPPQFDQQDREWALATIGYHITIVNNHIDHLEIIEDALIGHLTLIGSLEGELERRVRALHDISKELWDRAAAFRYLPFAFEQLGFLALEFEDAARQLGQVDSRVDYRSYEYDKWLREMTGKDIWRARRLLDEWGPRWEATGGKVGSN